MLYRLYNPNQHEGRTGRGGKEPQRDPGCGGEAPGVALSKGQAGGSRAKQTLPSHSLVDLPMPFPRDTY